MTRVIARRRNPPGHIYGGVAGANAGQAELEDRCSCHLSDCGYPIGRGDRMPNLNGRSILLCDYLPPHGDVELLDFSGARFHEPFFVYSLANCRRMIPRPLELAGNQRDVVDLLNDQRSLPIAGTIFHTGRCGSTLVANVLSALGTVLTLKEPPFLSAMTTAFLAWDQHEFGALEARVRVALDHLLPGTAAGQERIVLKFTSWNVLGESLWLSATSARPTAFIWRPLVEVLESIATTPAGSAANMAAFEHGWSTLRGAGLHLPEPLGTAAAAWLSTAAKGIELGTSGAAVLSYTRLEEDLEGSITSICDHFGIGTSSIQLQDACKVRQVYSKDPSGSLPFAVVRKPCNLDADLRRAVHRVAKEVEEALTELTADRCE